jgi:hypothetical protein
MNILYLFSDLWKRWRRRGVTAQRDVVRLLLKS